MKKLFNWLVILIAAGQIYAQVPYNTIPDWLSQEDSYYGTGAAIDDINGDGFPDLAISNGNDMLQAPNFAYLNSNGFMPDTAGWISANSAYSGHCELADLDSDGFPELAVSNFISNNHTWTPGQVQIYGNINGHLENGPGWASDSLYSFRLAWGDADADGDLDLAVATGEPYHSYLQQNLIFFNNNGVLDNEPGWSSADSDACLDVRWVDIDLDGDLDLAFCQSIGPLKIYFNFGDSISTLPNWLSSDNDNYNSIDFADLNGDGFPELAAAANTQGGGSGRFKLFRNNDGILETVPYWTSTSAGFGSEAALTDIDSDGDFDLVTGRWWGLIYIYLNNSGEFGAYPAWNNSGSFQSVVENIVFGDFGRGAERRYKQTFPADGRRLFQLPYRQLAGIDSVLVDGIPLARQSYCFSLWDGWVSIRINPNSNTEIFYRNSVSKDMAVANWDSETYIFHNNNPGFIPGDINDSGAVNGMDIVFLVNYLKGGPAPIPRYSADVDGNCQVNQADLAYLVDYLKGGPQPVAGDCD